jgi:hypothetical protein
MPMLMPPQPQRQPTAQSRRAAVVYLTWVSPSIVSGSPPLPRSNHTCTALHDAHLYVLGGESATGNSAQGHLRDLVVFDAAATTWSATARYSALPEARFGHTCTGTGNELYVFGGQTNRDYFLQGMLKLDINHMAWVQVHAAGAEPEPRSAHTATLVGRRIYFYGGTRNMRGKDGTQTQLTYGDMHYYNLDENSWTRVLYSNEPPIARCGHTAVGYGQRIYFHGGLGQNLELLNDLVCFDTATSTWIKEAPPSRGASADAGSGGGDRAVSGSGGTAPEMPSARIGHIAVRIDQWMVIWGGGSRTEACGEFWAYDLDKGKWISPKLRGAPLSGRYWHKGALLGTRLYVFGGGLDDDKIGDLFFVDLGMWRISSGCGAGFTTFAPRD